jgi:hypothetical protein
VFDTDKAEYAPPVNEVVVPFTVKFCVNWVPPLQHTVYPKKFHTLVLTAVDTVS